MKLVFFIKIILSLLIVNFASSQDHQEEKLKEIALEIINSAKYSVLTTVIITQLIVELWIILRLTLILYFILELI